MGITMNGLLESYREKWMTEIFWQSWVEHQECHADFASHVTHCQQWFSRALVNEHICMPERTNFIFDLQNLVRCKLNNIEVTQYELIFHQIGFAEFIEFSNSQKDLIIQSIVQ